MERGILIFAKNNEKIDYIKQATICSILAKHYLNNIPVCLISDQIITNLNFNISKQFKNFLPQKRRYNTFNSQEELSYFNIGRSSAYDLTPFTETLLLDSDYFIQNSTLDRIWGSDNDVMMNNDYCDILNPFSSCENKWLGNWGPPMHWATAVYFKKTPGAKIFFDLVKHVEDNYNFYRKSYNLPGRIIRNDFTFSIAAHLIGGIQHLPVPRILNSFEGDEILEVGRDSILFLCNRKRSGEFCVSRVKKLNVHIMNKIDLNAKLDLFLKAYKNV